jgi:hypothetical protein
MIARFSVLVWAVVLSSAMLVAIAAEDDPEVFIYSLHIDKQTDLVWAIKRSRLLAVPSWEPGRGEAPLSPNKAVIIANDYVQNVLGVHGASVLMIEMRQLGVGSENRWSYDVDYSSDPPLLSNDPRLHVTVAMDGKVIVPEKRPARQIK